MFQVGLDGCLAGVGSVVILLATEETSLAEDQSLRRRRPRVTITEAQACLLLTKISSIKHLACQKSCSLLHFQKKSEP